MSSVKFGNPIDDTLQYYLNIATGEIKDSKAEMNKQFDQIPRLLEDKEIPKIDIGTILRKDNDVIEDLLFLLGIDPKLSPENLRIILERVTYDQDGSYTGILQLRKSLIYESSIPQLILIKGPIRSSQNIVIMLFENGVITRMQIYNKNTNKLFEDYLYIDREGLSFRSRTRNDSYISDDLRFDKFHFGIRYTDHLQFSIDREAFISSIIELIKARALIAREAALQITQQKIPLEKIIGLYL